MRKTVTERIDFLFRTVHPEGREYRYAEVEQAMAALGYKVSDTTLHLLRTGARTNPTMNTLEALAKFFGVPAAYFFDDEQQRLIDEELKALALLRDEGVRRIAFRAAGLNRDNQELIATIIESMRSISAKDAGRAADPDAEPPPLP